MRTFPMLLSTLVLAALATGQTASERSYKPMSGNTTVGSKIHVSSDQPLRLHWEPVIAVDPENPKNLLACWINGEQVIGKATPRDPDSFVVVYASFDSGTTWRETLRITDQEGEPVVDPTCAFGQNGAAYASALVSGTPIFRSLDSGRTWIKINVLGAREWDREFVTVDNTQGKYSGRVYFHYMTIPRSIDDGGLVYSLELRRSEDRGENFVGPAKLVTTPVPFGGLFVGNATVLSDGSLAIILGRRTPPNPGRVVIAKSTDGGDSFVSFHTVGRWNTERTFQSHCFSGPVVATDGSEGIYKNRLYAVWTDHKTDGVSPMIAHSSDKGQTWSEPKMLDGRNSVNGCTTQIAVNSVGVVGILWYNQIDHPANRKEINVSHETWFTASVDGGESFLPPVKLSTGDIKPKRFRIGETIGLAAGPDGKFHALWIENRTGNRRFITRRSP